MQNGKIVDLHVHSTKSDGSLTPAQLVDYAIEKGLSAFALTDHDTTDGVKEAELAAKGKGIKVIPGIEFSSEYEGKDIHIVGLYIDYESDFFKRRLVSFVKGREVRNREMCRRLTEHGMPVAYEELTKAFPGCVITRGHFATYLLEHGYVKSRKEAFDRYIGDHGPCFVPRKKITPMRAVEIILKAGGFPILAHPLLYHMGKERLELLVSRLKAMGLQGIEAVYSTHTPAEERQIRELAEKYGLCISGGSDFHGDNKPGLDLAVGYGKLYIPAEILDKINERRDFLREHPESLKCTKILFTDLDGTLLNSKKQISEYTREVLQRWTEAGHKLVLCSGRDINSVMDVKRDTGLNFQGMYLIGSNGGMIYDFEKGKILNKILLTPSQIAYIAEMAKKHQVHCHSYSDTHIITPAVDEELVYYQHAIKTPVKVCEDVVSMLPEGACKCIAIELHDREKLENFRLEMLPFAEREQITMVYSNPYYLELFPSASGKGAAVRKLCEILNMDLCFSIAAGDAQNDISMIEAAGMGIAMANAAEEVKAAATTVTEWDNDHDGLARILSDMM